MEVAADIQLDFLRRVQRLLDEGRFTSTYKFGLLMTLADTAVEQSRPEAEGLDVSVLDLAERFIGYYWPQSKPFTVRLGEQDVLKQNVGQQAFVVRLLEEKRERYGSLVRLKKDSGEWQRVRNRVARLLLDMPIRHIHETGTSEGFLFIRTKDNYRLKMPMETAYSFRSLYQPIQMMIESAWIRWIKGQPRNRRLLGDEVDLEGFLFGTERGALAGMRACLYKLQNGDCFYCGNLLPRNGEVDHFIPWSRYPLDDGFNLVLAHRGCNQDKRALLPATEHLGSWIKRNTSQEKDIRSGANEAGLDAELKRALQVAYWAYSQVSATKGQAWKRVKQTEPLHDDWRNLFVDQAAY